MKEFESLGFNYFQNFISESEEQFLLNNFQTLNWEQIRMYGVTAKRRVIHFGLNYLYETRTVNSTAEPPPKFLHPFIERVAKKINVKTISEILITEYAPGAGIGWHKDASIFGDQIVGISLKNGCTLKLRNIKEKHHIIKIILESRSAYILSGKVRTEWQHSISPVKLLRYSITFRTLR